MQNQYCIKDIDRATNNLMDVNTNCNIVYPEIYYKVQPFIMCVCDQMELCGTTVSQEMLDQASDDIYDNVCMIHPDLTEYSGQPSMMNLPVETAQQRDRRRRFGQFRRRGLFRDFIDLLLINELFRRGTIIY